jgi:dihydrolipoamide dehydrogenase
MKTSSGFDVLVIGGGPAGLRAAVRAGDLGARTALVTRDAAGGMAALDGPVPVRTLAHAARLLRDARQLGRYGVAVAEPTLDYSRLLARVREVVDQVREHAVLRAQIASLGITLYERAGAAHFVDAHALETERGLKLRAEKVILCTGGINRPLRVPGVELTATHSDAWGLSAVPESMLVVGAGATGVQVASVFRDFGARVELFEAGPRILPTEDEAVSAAVAESFRSAGMTVREAFGSIEAFERTPRGVRMVFTKAAQRSTACAQLAVVAIGWMADTAKLGLEQLGVATDPRGFVRVDAHLRTSAAHVFAAGDVTGRLMLVPQALEDGYVAATNAVRGPVMTLENTVAPIGSFTDPEYAQVGLTETKAREARDVLVAVVGFDSTTRTIIDGRTQGFCKLIIDRKAGLIVGCHVVGERAVDIVQTAAIAMAGGMRVDQLARVPLSFPTYTGALGRAAAIAARELSLDLGARSVSEDL